MAVKTNSMDMIQGPLWGKIFKLTMFYMATAFLQQLYNTADIMVVGRFAGQSALAGVGACTTLVNLFLGFILGLAAGITIVIGQTIGERNTGEIKNASHTAIAMAILCGVTIFAVCFAFAKALLKMTGVPDDVMSEAFIYLRISAAGYIPSLVYNFGSSILCAKGDGKRPLYIVGISGIINVVLNVFFVCALKMGAAGVALATVIAQLFTAVAVMFILCREQDETRIYIHKIRIHKDPVVKMVRFGLPSGFENTIYSTANVLIQSSINSFGAVAIAGSAAAMSICGFYDLMLSSVYRAAVVFVSQNYGAREFGRIKKTMYISFTYVLIIWAIQAMVTYLFGKQLIGFVVGDNTAAIEMGWYHFGTCAYTYGILGFLNVMTGGLRGMGATIVNMFTCIVGIFGVRILWLFTAFKKIGTYQSLFVCYPLSWTVTLILIAVMFAVVFKKEKEKAQRELRT